MAQSRVVVEVVRCISQVVLDPTVVAVLACCPIVRFFHLAAESIFLQTEVFHWLLIVSALLKLSL